MFDGPIRGGTRGGHAEFKWSDVSADKDREHYLGHSINAPTGRWQKNKDVHWYNRDHKGTEAERQEEIKRVKEAEAEALAVALGFKPTPKSGSAGQTTSVTEDEVRLKEIEDPASKEERKREKEERRKHKEEKRALKELKRAKKMEKRRLKGEHKSDEGYEPRYRSRTISRSRSPPPKRIRDRSRSRSRSPYNHYSPDYRHRHRTRSRSRSRSPTRRRSDDRDGRRAYSERERRVEPIIRNYRR